MAKITYKALALFMVLIFFVTTENSARGTPDFSLPVMNLTFQADIYGDSNLETINYVSDLNFHSGGGFGGNAGVFGSSMTSGDGTWFAVSIDDLNSYTFDINDLGGNSILLPITRAEYPLGTVSIPSPSMLHFVWEIQKSDLHIKLHKYAELVPDTQVVAQYVIYESYKLENLGPAFTLNRFTEYLHMDDQTTVRDYDGNGLDETLLAINYYTTTGYPIFSKISLPPYLNRQYTLSGSYAKVDHLIDQPILVGTTANIARSAYISSTAKNPTDAEQQVANDAKSLIQRDAPYSISGHITDKNNNPISDVIVSDGYSLKAATNSSGDYTITSVPIGEYTIYANKIGYSFAPQYVVITAPPVAQGKDFLGTMCSSSQWKTEYFLNPNLLGNPVGTTCNDDIDFYWGYGNPYNVPYPHGPTDNYSLRWSRSVNFSQDGWYRFRTFTDDGSRVYVDGKIVIDDWSPHSFDERSALVNLSQGTHHLVMHYFNATGEAMAYLKWYFCPNGLIDCMTNITPQYQTRYPDVAMPLTANTAPPSNCNSQSILYNNIAGVGCKITSIAMALQSLNIQTTPVEINEWLSEIPVGANKPRGYPDLCTGDLLDYKQIENFVDLKKGVLIEPVTEENGKPINVPNAIRSGFPVVLQVPGNPKHFVLAINNVSLSNGSLNIDTLGILDPQHSYNCWVNPLTNQIPLGEILCHQPTANGVPSVLHRTTVNEFSWYIPRVYFRHSSNSPTSSLQIDIENAEILLTDSLGRSVGYDGTVGKEFFGIPGAFYMPGETPSQNVPTKSQWNTLYLSHAQSGEYNLEITPYGSNLLSMNSLIEINVHLIGYTSDMKSSVVDSQLTLPSSVSSDAIISFDPGVDLTINKIIVIFLPLVNN
jgi:hypothetical protein